jgi:hypothetical protein
MMVGLVINVRNGYVNIVNINLTVIVMKMRIIKFLKIIKLI